MQDRKFFVTSLMFLVTSCVSAPDTVVSPAPTNTGVVVVTPPDLEISIDQPEWMKDPNSDILLLPYGDSALFIDSKSADTLYLTLPNARWADNNHVLFTSVSENSAGTYQYVLDLLMWKITKVEPDQARSSNAVGGDEDFPNIWIDRNEENTPLNIYNDQLKRWDIFLYPPRGLYNLYEVYADNKVFVVQGDNAYGEGYVISVYDFKTKQILSAFVGNVEGNILKYSEGGVVYVTGNTPCIIDVQTLKRWCGKAIPNEYQGVKIGRLLPDKITLPFLYFKNDVENKSYYNLCLMNILSGVLTCPTEKLDVLRPESETISDINEPGETRDILFVKSIFSYSVSPDGEFVAFCYGSTAYSRYMGTVILDINEGDYRILDDQEFFPDRVSYVCQRLDTDNSTFQWRPLQ